MSFTNGWILYFLWLVPILAVLLIVLNRIKERSLKNYADHELLKRLTGKTLTGRRFIKGFLMLAAVVLMITALAGPRWGSHFQEVSRKGVDILILLDVSKSMLVEDVDPNRLERAKREVFDFLQVIQGDRIGLVPFAGAAFVQVPLTLDYAAVNMFLDSINPDLIPVPGTNLGEAINSGLKAFDDKSETDKVIFLITDGEDNEAKGLAAAEAAAAKGVKIFVLGIGETSGGPIPDTDNQGGFKKDDSGDMVLSKLDEESLKKIAVKTGGTYVRSVAGDLDLDILYFEGIRVRTTAKELKSKKIKVHEERFMIFLAAAFLLLVLEGMVNERKAAR